MKNSTQLIMFGDYIAISCLAITETPLLTLNLCSIYLSLGLSQGIFDSFPIYLSAFL